MIAEFRFIIFLKESSFSFLRIKKARAWYKLIWNNVNVHEVYCSLRMSVLLVILNRNAAYHGG